MRYDKIVFVVLFLGGMAFFVQKAFLLRNSFGPKVLVEELEFVPEKGLVLLHGEAFTGTSLEYYPHQQLGASIKYRDGKKHGKYKQWFEDGTLSFESNYVSGKRHGKTMTWWRNGLLRSKANYDKGVPHGVQMEYYSSANYQYAL